MRRNRNSAPYELGEQREYGLHLCELKRIDAYEYSKVRKTLYAATDASVMQAVLDWLEAQPDWSDFEFHLPNCLLAEIRDQNLLEREARAYRRRHERDNKSS